MKRFIEYIIEEGEPNTQQNNNNETNTQQNNNNESAPQQNNNNESDHQQNNNTNSEDLTTFDATNDYGAGKDATLEQKMKAWAKKKKDQIKTDGISVTDPENKTIGGVKLSNKQIAELKKAITAANKPNADGKTPDADTLKGAIGTALQGSGLSEDEIGKLKESFVGPNGLKRPSPPEDPITYTQSDINSRNDVPQSIKDLYKNKTEAERKKQEDIIDNAIDIALNSGSTKNINLQVNKVNNQFLINDKLKEINKKNNGSDEYSCEIDEKTGKITYKKNGTELSNEDKEKLLKDNPDLKETEKLSKMAFLDSYVKDKVNEKIANDDDYKIAVLNGDTKKIKELESKYRTDVIESAKQNDLKEYANEDWPGSDTFNKDMLDAFKNQAAEAKKGKEAQDAARIRTQSAQDAAKRNLEAAETAYNELKNQAGDTELNLALKDKDGKPIKLTLADVEYKDGKITLREKGLFGMKTPKLDEESLEKLKNYSISDANKDMLDNLNKKSEELLKTQFSLAKADSDRELANASSEAEKAKIRKKQNSFEELKKKIKENGDELDVDNITPEQYPYLFKKDENGDDVILPEFAAGKEYANDVAKKAKDTREEIERKEKEEKDQKALNEFKYKYKDKLEGLTDEQKEKFFKDNLEKYKSGDTSGIESALETAKKAGTEGTQQTIDNKEQKIKDLEAKRAQEKTKLKDGIVKAIQSGNIGDLCKGIFASFLFGDTSEEIENLKDQLGDDYQKLQNQKDKLMIQDLNGMLKDDKVKEELKDFIDENTGKIKEDVDLNKLREKAKNSDILKKAISDAKKKSEEARKKEVGLIDSDDEDDDEKLEANGKKSQKEDDWNDDDEEDDADHDDGDDDDSDSKKDKDGKIRKNPAKIWHKKKNKRTNKISKNYYNKKGASITPEEFKEKIKAYKEIQTSESYNPRSLSKYVFESTERFKWYCKKH